MKRAWIFILLLLPLVGLAQQTVFTGKWDLNLRKTDFKQAPESLIPRSLEIKQKNGTIIIEAKIYDKQMVQHYYTETLPFDGTKIETTTYETTYETYKRIVSLKWNLDNKSFVLSIRPMTGDDQGPDFTETWSLENGGKTLLVDREATQANDYSVKAYYDKK